MKTNPLVPSLSLFSALVLPFILGCGSPHSDPEVAPIAPAPVAEKAADNCDTLRLRLNHNHVHLVDQQKDVKIERHFQRVIRKNCSGTVESDHIETVLSPRADIQLMNLLKKEFKSVFVYNEETCAHSLTSMPLRNWPLIGLLHPITGDGKKSILVKGDLAPAVFTFRLNEGLNHIFTEYFYDCSPLDIPGNNHAIHGDGNCQAAKSSAIVEYPILVHYEEKHLDGFTEVIPSEESCKEKRK